MGNVEGAGDRLMLGRARWRYLDHTRRHRRRRAWPGRVGVQHPDQFGRQWLCGREGDHHPGGAGDGEVIGKGAHAIRIGTSELEDRMRRVREGAQSHSRSREASQQTHPGVVELLEGADEDGLGQPAGCPMRGACGRLGDDRGGLRQQVGVVDDPALGLAVGVLPGELDERLPLPVDPPSRHVGAVVELSEELGHRHPARDQGGGRIPDRTGHPPRSHRLPEVHRPAQVAIGQSPAQQLPDGRLLLRPAEDPDRTCRTRPGTGGLGDALPSHDGERPAMRGCNDRGHRTRRQLIDDGGTHRVDGTTIRHEDHHPRAGSAGRTGDSHRRLQAHSQINKDAGAIAPGLTADEHGRVGTAEPLDQPPIHTRGAAHAAGGAGGDVHGHSPPCGTDMTGSGLPDGDDGTLGG